MYTRTKVKRWGNSLGIVIPKEAAEELEIFENEEIDIDIKKPKKITDLLGMLKGKKIQFTEEDRFDVRD